HNRDERPSLPADRRAGHRLPRGGDGRASACIVRGTPGGLPALHALPGADRGDDPGRRHDHGRGSGSGVSRRPARGVPRVPATLSGGALSAALLAVLVAYPSTPMSTRARPSFVATT